MRIAERLAASLNGAWESMFLVHASDMDISRRVLSKFSSAAFPDAALIRSRLVHRACLIRRTFHKPFTNGIVSHDGHPRAPAILASAGITALGSSACLNGQKLARKVRNMLKI